MRDSLVFIIVELITESHIINWFKKPEKIAIVTAPCKEGMSGDKKTTT
jgi:hypothetical protein